MPEESARLVIGGVLFEGGDEVGELLVGDAAKLVDLDAVEASGPDEGVDLVASDLEDLGDLFDGVCLHDHLLSPRAVSGDVSGVAIISVRDGG
jgi:hypothetical protein